MPQSTLPYFICLWGLSMKMIYGDIWQQQGVKCIPTNGVVKANGELVMGAGLALQAMKRYPGLPRDAGLAIKLYGNKVFYFSQYQLITVPTKQHYSQNSTVELISESLDDLIKVVTVYNLKSVYVPLLGCGLGGLDENLIIPLMHSKLDDTFTLVISK